MEPPRRPPPGQWCYNQDGKWHEFDAKSADVLDRASNGNGTSISSANLGGKDRPVRKMVVQWYWKRRSGWNLYDAEANHAIEGALRKGQEEIDIEIDRENYRIDLNTKTQTNTTSRRNRSIIRTLLDPTSKAGHQALSREPAIRPPKRALDPEASSTFAKILKLAIEEGVASHPSISIKIDELQNLGVTESDKRVPLGGICRLCPRRRVNKRDLERYPHSKGHPRLTERHYVYHLERDIKQ
ncbi:hypothetical protein AAMO2058_000734200, partial [Amorphochlora amoebiformis]